MELVSIYEKTELPMHPLCSQRAGAELRSKPTNEPETVCTAPHASRLTLALRQVR